MPVVVDDIRISNEFNSGNVRYLHGNVFWKLDIEIDFHHKFFYKTDADNELLLNPLPLYSIGDGIIQIGNTSGEFAELKAGDIIVIDDTINPPSTRTVSEIIDNSTIRVIGGLPSGVLAVGSVIYLDTSYDSIDYYFGLVGNNEAVTYNSKIDNSAQRFQKAGLTSVYQNMTPIGIYKSWLLGDAQVKTNGVGLYGERGFQIKQTVYINPLFLKDYDNLIPPSYFLNNECLRHVFKVELRPTLNDFTRVRTGLFSNEEGNTGWFDENFNTGLKNYSISGLLFEKETPLTTVTDVLLITGNRTKVTFDCDAITGAPFVNGLTEGVVSFINVPFEDSEYKNTATTQSDNFMFDRVFLPAGGSPTNGARVIEDAQIQLVSASKLRITLFIDLDSTEHAKISAMDTKKYLIAFSISNHTLSAGSSDGVTLLVRYSDFGIELGTDNLVTTEINKFIQHPKFGTLDEGFDNIFVQEDEIVNYFRFKVDATSAFVVPKIIKIESGIRIYNPSTGVYGELESSSIDVSGRPIVNQMGWPQEDIIKGYQAPLTEAIKHYIFRRDGDFDNPPNLIWYFDVYYPFLLRWEYWIANANVPANFFSIQQQNNGFNNFWSQYDDVLPWVFQAYHDITFSFNGALTTYRKEKTFSIKTYRENPDWTLERAKFYDLANNDLGLNILGFADTKVVAEFTWVGVGPAPSVTALGMVLRLEPAENGGHYISTRIGSYRPKGSESQFKSIDLSDMVVISMIGNTVYGTAIIDHTKLQSGFNRFSLTGRLYELAAVSDCAEDNIISEASECFITEGGDNIITE